jgi:hypothetical protein
MSLRPELEEKTDQIIQEMGWEPRLDGGWEYVARDNQAVNRNKRRAKSIAQLLGVTTEDAQAYCDRVEF